MSGKELSFTVTKEEFLAYMRKYVFISKQMTRLSVHGIILILIISAVMIIREGINTSYAGMFILSIVGIIVGIYLYYIKPSKEAARLGDCKEYCYTFMGDDIVIREGAEEKVVNWVKFHEAYESDIYFYIIDAQKNPIVIPKRAFETADEMYEFKCMVRENVAKYRERL